MSANNIYTNANKNSFFPSFCKTKTSGYERLDQDVLEEKASWRDLIGFFICGLLNNFGYSVMLSAASDMLTDGGMDTGSPAIVLLADIFPSLVIQAIAPWFMGYIPYSSRIIFIVSSAIASFILPALFSPIWIKLLGVVLASISSGFGEINFLALTSYYHKNTVSAFSSGTGAAGVLGSFSYLFLTYLFSSTKSRLLVSCPLPLGMAISYFFIMTAPTKIPTDSLQEDDDSKEKKRTQLPLNTKLKLMVQLIPFMIPLFLVYFGEYLINQSIDPVLEYPRDTIIHPHEYVYYQALYQIGVFISRSSVNIFPIKRLWLPALFQTINAVFLSFVAIWNFIPSVWIIFCIIFWEGLLGGCIYVNTFYRITERFENDEEREFCLGGTSVSYALSITLSAAAGIGWTPFLRSARSYFGN